MSDNEDGLASVVATSQSKRDKEERAALREYYDAWIRWEGRGVCHDLRVIYNIPNPTRELLRSIALGLSYETGIGIGRHEKRLKELMIGWINSHYEHFQGIIPELVLGDSTGPLAGDLRPLIAYRRDHPDDPGLRGVVKDSDFH
jgi:hypothetical protein